MTHLYLVIFVEFYFRVFILYTAKVYVFVFFSVESFLVCGFRLNFGSTGLIFGGFLALTSPKFSSWFSCLRSLGFRIFRSASVNLSFIFQVDYLCTTLFFEVSFYANYHFLIFLFTFDYFVIQFP